MNFGQMQDYVTNSLGLEDIDSYDETSMVAMWLNQGVIDILARTRCVARCIQMETQNGVDTYTLDANILALIDLDNLASLDPNDDGNTIVVPRRYHAARTEQPYYPAFRLIRADVIQIVPAPTVDGMTVQVWAVLKPQPMAAPSDDPNQENFGAIPYDFHDAIITYALWKCADYGDDASSQQGERYRTLYEGSDGTGGRLGQIRRSVNKRGTSIPVRRRVRLRPSTSGSFVG